MWRAGGCWPSQAHGVSLGIPQPFPISFPPRHSPGRNGDLCATLIPPSAATDAFGTWSPGWGERQARGGGAVAPPAEIVCFNNLTGKGGASRERASSARANQRPTPTPVSPGSLLVWTIRRILPNPSYPSKDPTLQGGTWSLCSHCHPQTLPAPAPWRSEDCSPPPPMETRPYGRELGGEGTLQMGRGGGTS